MTTQFKVGDTVRVIDLTLHGGPGFVYLKRGELGTVIENEDPFEPGSVRVRGHESDLQQWIDMTALEPAIDTSKIHDYVYEGADDE